MELINRYTGCLLGLAAGDAVGTTVEFHPRGTFLPLNDMVGGGPFQLKPGEWTDDTSMALCLATSLIEKDSFDAVDQMERYSRWYKNGYLSSNGRCFDIGNTTLQALNNFLKTGDAFSGSTKPEYAGNGSIMRLAPVALAYYPDREKIRHFAAESSRTTHGAQECVDACRLLGDILYYALDGRPKDEVLSTSNTRILESPKIQGIASGKYRSKTEQDIHGKGYVVDCLEAALWCFYTTETFTDAVLKAVNLGEDADTTAAVCGQVAGAFYGVKGIPSGWIDRLAKKDEISSLADGLYEFSQHQNE